MNKVLQRGLVPVLVLGWISYLSWREREIRRESFRLVQGYAKAQADLCEELYQAKWGEK